MAYPNDYEPDEFEVYCSEDIKDRVIVMLEEYVSVSTMEYCFWKAYEAFHQVMYRAMRDTVAVHITVGPLTRMILDYLQVQCQRCFQYRFYHSRIKYKASDIIQCIICGNWFCEHSGCYRKHYRVKRCKLCDKVVACPNEKHECVRSTPLLIGQKRKSSKP
jgi:hypothetical protein